MRLVFGVSGASGMPLAQMALECFARIPDLELHLIVSKAARLTIKEELGGAESGFGSQVHASYDADELGAPPASGSWQSAGMIICPCSMATLGAIASGCGSNLLHRAADVSLKERRPLVLAVRETPFNLIHIRNMLAAAQAGASIMPFIPAFYTGDGSMRAAMIQFCGRMLDIIGISHSLCSRWKEKEATSFIA